MGRGSFEGRSGSGSGRSNFEGNRSGFEGTRGSGGRGQGGGGGRRFNRRDRAPNVEDERDFPSLGGAPAPPVEVM